MTDKRKETNCRLGLDIGTSRVVLARRAGQEFEFHSQLNAFVRVPYSHVIESVFKKEKIPHEARGDEVLIYGNDSEMFANLFHVETRRPMVRGALNPGEPDGPAMVRQIVAQLLSVVGAQGGRICFSIPAAPPEAAEDLHYHEAVLRQTLAEFGFEITCVNEGLAVVYGELENTNYSGIGISWGAGLTNVCLAYLSVPVISFSVPKAGDFVDASAASAAGELATRIRFFKEHGFHFNGAGDKVRQALTVYYDQLVERVIEAMCKEFAEARPLPGLDRPLPIVLAGGSALPQGFRERFEKALAARDFPLSISEVRQSPAPLFSTARGALVAAEALD